MSIVAEPASLLGRRVIAKTYPAITRHALALYCGASGDHNPIHVDIDFAKAAGFPDVFAHGMFVMARLGRALTDAVMQKALRSFSVRFVAITQIGAELTCEATVTVLFLSGAEQRAKLALVVRDQNGEVKLQGEATAALDGWERALG